MSKITDYVVVTTACGKLRGTLRTSIRGDLYYCFKGIPYAKPPIGPLKFHDPEPINPWTGIRDALYYGPSCAQYDNATKTVRGSDDCLYLNIYTKSLGDFKPKPVMVWIHGGAYVLGSSDDILYGPDYLLMEDVVLITFNYRLGILGFLNLEDVEAPGNFGFKDQIMVLKWVQYHIARFGGDPDNVTIFGESAGSSSVHFLTLSPLATGLFHKAICQSGCALNPWSTMHNPKEPVYELLDLLNFSERDPKAIVDYLRTVEINTLIEMQNKIMTPKKWIQAAFPFGPGVDDKSPNPFMPIPVSEAAKQGIQVPLIMGYTNKEGIFLFRYLSEINIQDLNSDFDQYVSPRISEILEHHNLTLQDLKQIYFGDEDISNKNIEKLIDFWGDTIFVEGIHRTLSIQAKVSGAPTYFYEFSYDKNITPYKEINLPVKGASHGEDLNYLFSTNGAYDLLPMQQLQQGTGAEQVMKRIIQMWVNFAKHGRPTSTLTDIVPLYWKPIDSDVNFRYMSISDDLRMETMLNIKERYSQKRIADVNT